ncbi:MAG: hypothetical protein HQL55_07265 [Magnetococcales bacterium]|nr:hypothetical protein [Magnetococcales bacterium]
MIDQTVLLKVDAAAQAAQLPALSGKTFTVAKTVTAGDGVCKWLVMVPQGGGKAVADGVVVLKVEGGKQVLGNLVGQTFTVGKAPVMAKGAGEWLVLQPQAAKGATGVKAFLSGSGLANQGAGAKVATAQVVNGVVGTPPMDPNLALALKGVEFEAPEAAAAVVKGAAGKGAVAKGAVVAAKGGVGAKVGGTAVASATTSGAASGTIWSGTGTSLGLGLGLGGWGPVILVGVVAAVGVGVCSYLKKRNAGDGTDQLQDVIQ